MSETSEILNERSKTHGPYKRNSVISQNIKEMVRNELRNKERYVPEYINEGLDMIIHKLSRIAAGNHMEVDHYRDIAGYAELIVRELERFEKEIDQDEPLSKYNRKEV